jgi:MerR family transcriptional regulator, light-induced transcriptional regulator
MSDPLLTIGALSRAVGIPAETLRTWERRYGFPTATRTGGRQRLYDAEVVPRLRLVGLALARGLRPAQVLTADVSRLRELVGEEPTGSAMACVGAMDATGLERVLRGDAARLGLPRFLTDELAPLLRRVGEAWARGELSVAQEHFASEVVRAFLVAQWRPLAEANRGPVALLATPAGERHELGLQMAAVVTALAGWRVAYLGADVPDLDLTARASSVGVVLLGVSAAYGAHGALSALLAALGGRVLVGGAGAPAGVSLVDLDTLPAALARVGSA